MAISSANVTTVIGNVYTSSGNSAITFLAFCNTSAGTSVANVYIVPSGGSANVINQVLSDLSVTTKDTYQMYSGGEKLLLGNGDMIQASANANNALHTVVSYTSI